jgi:hypothetical protein
MRNDVPMGNDRSEHDVLIAAFEHPTAAQPVIEPVAIEQHAPERHVVAVTDSAQGCAGEPL